MILKVLTKKIFLKYPKTKFLKRMYISKSKDIREQVLLFLTWLSQKERIHYFIQLPKSIHKLEGYFLFYDKGFFKINNNNLFIQDLIVDILKYFKFDKSIDENFISKTIKKYQQFNTSIHRKFSDFDQWKMTKRDLYLCIENGTLNLKKNKNKPWEIIILPHDPKYMFTKKLDTKLKQFDILKFSPKIECPVFWKAMNKTLRKSDFELVLQLISSLILPVLPVYNLEVTPLFYRSGMNFKGSCGRLVSSFFDDVDKSTIFEICSDFGLSSLIGKDFIFADESNIAPNDLSNIKRIISQEMCSINPKHREAFNFLISSRVLICSNTFPSYLNWISDLRRIAIIPFIYTFDENSNSDIDELLQKEKNGIMKLLLVHLTRLLDNFDRIKGSIYSRNDNLIHLLNNPIEIFCESKLKKSVNLIKPISTAILKKEYDNFSKSMGLPKLSQNQITSAVKQHFNLGKEQHKPVRIKGKVVQGLKGIEIS